MKQPAETPVLYFVSFPYHINDCKMLQIWVCRWVSTVGVQGRSPCTPRDRPAVSGAALSALTRTGRCKKVYGSYRKISIIYKGFLDCKPSCATARVRGLSPLRHRPPFALREGGFAPFTPAIEETQQPAKPQFICYPLIIIQNPHFFKYYPKIYN